MCIFVKVAEIQPSSVRVGLKINMRTPTIIMPKMSKSPDLLLFRFDSLQIDLTVAVSSPQGLLPLHQTQPN